MQAQRDWNEYYQVLGQCRYVTTYDQATIASEEILATKPVYLGFDVEAIDGVAAIVTLATATKVYLFRLNSINFQGEFPQAFIKILASNGVSKIANAIPMDVKFLRPYRFQLGGLIDLQQLSRARGYPLNLKKAFHTAFPYFPKMLEIYQEGFDTWFNWNACLSEEHIIYAAYDARASYLLFQFYLGLIR